MTRGDTVTVGVDQAFVQRAADESVIVVASSLDGEDAERHWAAMLEPLLVHIGAGQGLRYVALPEGFAAVLGRTEPGATGVHALLGLQTDLTPTAALALAEWPGWSDDPPSDLPVPRLRTADLDTQDAAQRSRSAVLSPDSDRVDMLASAVAWLLQSPDAPLALVNCPAEDRLPLLWCLLDIAFTPVTGSRLEAARAKLAARSWTFSTGGDVDHSAPPAIGFLDALPVRAAQSGWMVVDLDHRQSAAPRHVADANGLVYRYEFGVDPPADPADTPAPMLGREVISGTMHAGDVSPTADRSPVPGPARWFEPLLRNLVAAPDKSGFEQALDDLEHAAGERDDRADLRAALEYEDWAVDVISRTVPLPARDMTYDRVVRLAFGGTSTGRESDTAQVDAQRLALTSPSDELVRALARAPGAADLAPAIAQRWLRQPPPVKPDRKAGLGPVGRFLARWWPMTTDRERLVLTGLVIAALLVGFAFGVVIGAA